MQRSLTTASRAARRLSLLSPPPTSASCVLARASNATRGHGFYSPPMACAIAEQLAIGRARRAVLVRRPLSGIIGDKSPSYRPVRKISALIADGSATADSVVAYAA